VLGGQPQPVPAGEHDPHVRAAAGEQVGERGHPGQEVRAVVQHQDRRVSPQPAEQGSLPGLAEEFAGLFAGTVSRAGFFDPVRVEMRLVSRPGMIGC
jgi:hypothetical protein